MTNEFVNYLNSMNNAASDTVNALAESQVKTPYYDKIKVVRKLGTFIANKVKANEHTTFILTGHAGDGKTSILVQVLHELGLIESGEGLGIERQHYGDGKSLFYVKDMSEIDSSTQESMLHKALNSPANNSSSVLVSNTGPLLNTFDRYIGKIRQTNGMSYTLDDTTEFQTLLLNQLDENEDALITVEGFNFMLINIARVDNVSFARKVLGKIVEDSLWQPCEQCSKKAHCPIFFNKTCVKTHFERVSTFVENYYRYIYENDKRMTIRQMLSQISFSFTGNLNCDKVRVSIKKPHFNYNFANLFFGYKGIDELDSALQIKGIEQIMALNLDGVALDVDYILFVNQNFGYFPINIRVELENAFNSCWKMYSYQTDSEPAPNARKTETKIRRAVRRFYLMYSTYDNIDQVNNILNQVFGEVYSDYIRFISKPCNSMTFKKKMQNLIFEALYINNTAFPARSNVPLYLTLRREDDAFQNVLLILGKVEKEKFKIEQERIHSKFEDSDEKYELYIKFDDEKKFKLSLPLVLYFKSIVNGAVVSNSNPTLTHGVAKLNTLLHNIYRFTDSDNVMRVLINTTKEQIAKEYSFDGDKLYFE